MIDVGPSLGVSLRAARIVDHQRESALSVPPATMVQAMSHSTRLRSWTGRNLGRAGIVDIAWVRPVRSANIPQRGHPDHAHHAVAVGGDPQVRGPSGKLTHVGSASSQEILVGVAITIFPCVAGTFAYPDLTKQSRDQTLVNVQG